MKKYYILFAPLLSISMLSCHSNTSDTGSEKVVTPNANNVVSEKSNPTTQMDPTDTIGLAAFKAEQQKKYADSIKLVGIYEQRQREGKHTLTAIPSNTSSNIGESSDRTESNSSTISESKGSNNSNSSSSGDYVAKKKKKGMSNGTKGALIGGGAGALTGALVTKHNRGVGALVGAAAGGGAGYLIGHSKDKKKKDQ